MAIRKTLSCLIIAATIGAASMAQAGKETVPNTVSVFTPAAVASVQAAIAAVRSGNASAVVNTNGGVTVTFSNGTVQVFTSSFIASVIAAYL
jgi:hypothetical protein